MKPIESQDLVKRKKKEKKAAMRFEQAAKKKKKKNAYIDIYIGVRCTLNVI